MIKEKRTIVSIPWTIEEDNCIKEIAAQRPNATRYYQRESFKQHHPNTKHTGNAIEGRFSMVAPKYTSKKWPKERCKRLVEMKQSGMSDKDIAKVFQEEGVNVSSVGVASQCAAMRCRGSLKGSGQIKKAYTREINGVRQTKMDLSDTMPIPPVDKSLDNEQPGEQLKGRVQEAAARMSKLTGEQMHLAHRLFDSLDKILG